MHGSTAKCLAHLPSRDAAVNGEMGGEGFDDIIMTVLAQGNDTTSLVLLYVLHARSQNPERHRSSVKNLDAVNSASSYCKANIREAKRCTHPTRRPHHPFKTLSNCPAAPIWAMHHGEANFAHPDPNFRDGQLGSPLTQKDASIDGQRLRLCLQLDISILFCRFPVKVDMPRRKYASDESTVNAVTLPVYKLRPYHAVLTQRPCDCPVQFVMMASDNPCFLVVNGFSNVLDKI